MTTQVVTHQIVASYADTTSHGSITVLHFSEQARLMRSLKASGVCLLVACVCLCIPGAHFILVPLTLLISPFIILRIYREKTRISHAEISCAKCREPLVVLATQELYPLFENCGACHREIKIQAG